MFDQIVLIFDAEWSADLRYAKSRSVDDFDGEQSQSL